MLHFWLFIWVSNLISQIKVKHRLRVSKNGMQRKIFGLKGSNKRRKNFIPRKFIIYSSPNIITVNKSKRMSPAGLAANMGRMEMLTHFWWRNPEGKSPLEDLSENGAILK
jgi:hypothetical protein